MYLGVICIVSFLTSTLAHPGLLGLDLGDILSPLVGPVTNGGYPDRRTTQEPNIPKELSSPKPTTDRSCIPPKTKLTTNTFKYCKGDLVFSDDFEKPFNNHQSWDIEQYMPIEEGPDFEFVSYENDDRIVYKKNGRLIFNPTPRFNESEVFGELDLRNGCTSILPSECYFKRISTQLIPPVRSAKITNKFGFTYGKIEVKAKLPQGDWIYPQIQLVSDNKYAPFKILVAYSRGNNHYVKNRDEGSSLLFGGILWNTENSDSRMKLTESRPSLEPYGNKTHTYTVIWEPDSITLLFNGEEYGRILIDIDNDERFYPLKRTFRLSLGVGVGGIHDFPEGYISIPKKPWVNADRNQLKNFFDARTEWAKTWSMGRSIMEVDSVKIYAV
nr:beta-1,3-glucan-binding protein 1-like [Onthophagus taurus]